ncbi:hypothetical protein HPB52_010143 [Rhipicephalus sanguineus]|uniref:Uncharacterized protein n=1 Tax=Rhipicephalus sanguineus TaxID=34632 RepID=A0A9D4PVH8_RHISA|nr:hypothetical protein HPB52_010143 [Rhipicephalus sanguineus]
MAAHPDSVIQELSRLHISHMTPQQYSPLRGKKIAPVVPPKPKKVTPAQGLHGNSHATAKGEPVPKHRYNLPPHVCKALLPIYERLSDERLLERCQRGKTQNSNESLHSIVWAHSAKERHASLLSVQAAVAEAVVKFNAGNEAASAAILKELKLNPGPSAKKRMAEKDRRRSTASARKRASAENMQRALKKRHLGDSKQKDYLPGAY